VVPAQYHRAVILYLLGTARTLHTGPRVRTIGAELGDISERGAVGAAVAKTASALDQASLKTGCDRSAVHRV
jgi:hypothetical protein